jgi:catechol 2,3-dioxygenase-like lactoylglutathione lyase family enzyme
MTGIGLVSYMVRDYDEAIAFFTQSLNFELVQDMPMGPGKRWVVVRPKNGVGAGLVLAQAKNGAEISCIGAQTGGRVFLFLETDDFARDYAHFTKNGVKFNEEPRFEPYGTVAVFADLYGNLWDLIEHRKSR